MMMVGGGGQARLAFVSAVGVVAVGVIACDPEPPEPYECEGVSACMFAEVPTTTVTIETEAGDVRPAGYGCAPEPITFSTGPISVAGSLLDFQTGQLIPLGIVQAFFDADLLAPVATATSDQDGLYAIALPSGTPSQMYWRVSGEAFIDTIHFAVPLDVTTAELALDLRAVSWIGVSPAQVPVLVSVVHDCQGLPVEHAIATLTIHSGSGNVLPPNADFVEGAEVYYFSAGTSTSLPIRRSLRADTNRDGQFVLTEIPLLAPGAQLYVQVWGFLDEWDVPLGRDGLTLLSELPLTLPKDSVVTTSSRPTEGPL